MVAKMLRFHTNLSDSANDIVNKILILWYQRVPQIIDAILNGHRKGSILHVNDIVICGLEKNFSESDDISGRREIVKRRQEGNLRDCISRTDGKEQVRFFNRGKDVEISYEFVILCQQYHDLS